MTGSLLSAVMVSKAGAPPFLLTSDFQLFFESPQSGELRVVILQESAPKCFTHCEQEDAAELLPHPWWKEHCTAVVCWGSNINASRINRHICKAGKIIGLNLVLFESARGRTSLNKLLFIMNPPCCILRDRL